MGCSSCNKGSDGLPRGCKSNGRCGTCGCGSNTVFDWLEGIALPNGAKAFDIVEVRFKNNRKGFFRRKSTDSYHVGDVVTLNLNPGHDVGVVTLTGELVRAQMSARKVRDDHEVKHIMHKSTAEEIEVWHTARQREEQTRVEAREIIKRIGIGMKLTDVEYQGDMKKATFYYIADERVDFRELVRELASKFGVRIDMRQIGARQEAARVGGIGSCGRELCCSVWLTDFRSVSTGAARYQQLALDPVKLAGQCGKLKCCLNFELDQYVEAVKQFPSPHAKVNTFKGKAVVFKMDIFKEIVYFLQLGESGGGPIAVPVEEANRLIEISNKGEKINSLTEFAVQEEVEEIDSTYSNVVGQDDLTRFDKNKGGRRGGGNKGGGHKGGGHKGGGNKGRKGGRGRNKKPAQAK
jgi:cell fate regulator YaaT (PSP1 superfamily)